MRLTRSKCCREAQESLDTDKARVSEREVGEGEVDCDVPSVRRSRKRDGGVGVMKGRDVRPERLRRRPQPGAADGDAGISCCTRNTRPGARRARALAGI